MASNHQSSEVQNLTVDFQPVRNDNSADSCKVCAIVPVRNEAMHLFETLESLKNQTDLHGNPLPKNLYEVLVLVNNSSDESFQIARDYQARFPDFAMSVADISLEKEQAHIGTVRRLLMDEAYRRLTKQNCENGIIASTDGDTMVDSRWIAQIIAEIGNGNDAVGGRILTKKDCENGRSFHLRDVTYRCLLAQAECIIDPQRHNPYPCHHQYFGANMAVTAKMYAQAGGLPVLPYLEDAAFHKALIGQDAKIRKSFDVKVYTSSRTDGRVDIGFSEQLRRWQDEEKSDHTQMVESVGEMLDMFRVRSLLRNAWCFYQQNRIIPSSEIELAASMLETDLGWLKNMMAEVNYFGQFWHEVQQSNGENPRRPVTYQPIQDAISELRRFVKSPVATAFQTSPAGRYQHADLVSA